MRISDWSSDVCSSDLAAAARRALGRPGAGDRAAGVRPGAADPRGGLHRADRRAEHPAGAEGGRPGVSARGRPHQDERTVPRSPGERGRPPRLYRALKRFHLRGISPVEFSLLDPFLWETVIQGLLFGGVLALLSLGLNIVFGVIDVVWICYAELIMLGMYAIYFLYVDFGAPLPLAFLGGVLVVAVLGVIPHQLVIRPILHTEPINQLLVTGGVLFFLQGLATMLFSVEIGRA